MPTTSVLYRVNDESHVALDVRIGDAQIGGSVVFLGRDEIASGDENMQDIRLRRGADLRGEVLVVSTTVIDVRPEHDRTSVTVNLRGGFPDSMPVVQAASARPNGAVNYLTVVRFV